MAHVYPVEGAIDICINDFTLGLKRPETQSLASIIIVAEIPFKRSKCQNIFYQQTNHFRNMSKNQNLFVDRANNTKIDSSKLFH